MAQETLGVFAIVFLLAGMAVFLIPHCYPAVPRAALVTGFIPSAVFMVLGVFGHDMKIVSAEAYTSMWAVALIAALLVPQVTVAIALHRKKMQLSRRRKEH